MGSSILEKFLSRNSVSPTNHLPLVHSAEAFILKKSLSEGVLKTAKCSVFKNEDLLYFFVGRPAYKKDAVEEGEYWELPSCIVFEFGITDSVRVFPFDSGAFSAGRYPQYINMMSIQDFEINPSELNIKRAIGAFFKTNKDYYRLNPISPQSFANVHDVDATEEEILALHKLIQDRSKRFDDRRFSIEMQFPREFSFSERKPIFAIFPENYIQSEKFMSWIDKHDIILETYPYYPLRRDYYYSAIYEKLEKYYRESGIYEI
ncbi:hypothetical protein CO666_27680 [Rhizobium chutanense]|uniref:Uncharacterized protein n=1 Tax=Rhizobium chutanense TaxID=2035448 RepID=A0A2A6J4S0_9HYPH|nr:hypothetical protein [Rhizobium chutanense]PDT00920.1 hypothetical protein CO666_27680 [Rhizobium chutanense]